jgi:3-hydroxybutyryl-CoA dehydratase
MARQTGRGEGTMTSGAPDRNGTGHAESSMTDSWVRATTHATRSVVEAQRATLSMFGFFTAGASTAVDHGENGTTAPADEVTTDDAESTADDALPSWEWDRTVDSREELTVGDRVRFSKTLTDRDVAGFAAASGDTNRLHLDDGFAEETRFGGRIVHGTLVSGLISAALARLPGLTIYLSQDVRFLGPVRPNTRVTAVVEILEDLDDNRYRLSTVVDDEDGETVVEGEAVVLIDDLPVDEPAVLERPTREL